MTNDEFMSELETALEFIRNVERENPDKSAYQIANILRGYTRKNYTSRLWSTATGYHQEYIEGEFQGKLNGDVLLSGETTDFGHFLASLSDRWGGRVLFFIYRWGGRVLFFIYRWGGRVLFFIYQWGGRVLFFIYQWGAEFSP
ncbi:hypothetical protein [Coleofasciculus sp. F4-SAH-05]|uniref:hypothetical protein n=1 Tax=Coleofasciculus sp. F4-SAH-05 TaxID=3069525 RepID=UPI00330499ED